jgi:enoyl-CoA hydratase/carnithine racemase
MLGRRVDASEAAAIGLVNRAVPAGTALAAAFEWAETVASRPPEALRYAKVAMRIGAQSSLAASVHGLVSQACHDDNRYRNNTESFKR